MNNCTPTPHTLTAAELPAHAASIRRYLSGMLRPDELADATQIVMQRALESLPRYRGDSSPRVWLLGIARNTAFELSRGRQAAVSRLAGEDEDGDAITSESVAAPDAGLETSAEVSADRARVLAALTRVSATDRTALVASYVMDMPGPEAAAVCGISEPAYRQRLTRARLALAGSMDALRSVSTRQCVALVDRWRAEQAAEAEALDAVFAVARGHAVPA